MVEEKIDTTVKIQETRRKIQDKPSTNKQQTAQLPKTRRHSALSMKSLNDERVSTKKKEVVDYSNLPNNPFTTEQIQKQWQITIKMFKNQGDKLLASLMDSCTPIAKENVLHIELPSKLMKIDFEKSKQKILPSLREGIKNYKIDFEIAVNEEKVKKFAYTPQEKFAYLKDKNKLVGVLKTKFNLDL